MSEVEALHEEIAKLRGQLAERDAKLVELAASEARLKVALLEIEQIKMQLAVLRRQRYGQSSERLDGEIVQLELRLEDLEETVGEQIAASPRPREAKDHERKPTGRKPLPPHLPREVVVHEPEIICQCGGCDPGRLTKIGETTTEVLEKIPARLKVIRHVRPKYACRRCEAVFQAPAPELPIEKGRPGPGLLAHIAVSKYCDGLPLYRQAGILAREGIDISRAVLAEWVGQVAWWLVPLAERIGQYVMAQSVIWTDDTPIRTLAPGKGKTNLSRFWCYAVDPRPYAGPGQPAVLYRYSADRKGERPRTHLEGFRGYLHADAYSGYEALYRRVGRNAPQVQHVACLAHARRKFFEVFDASQSAIAEEALRRIQDLYVVEDDIRGQPAAHRRSERQAWAKPLLDAFHAWAIAQRRRLSSKAPLAKAFQYALNRWDALTRYIEDGRLSIDNNLSERLLRGIAVTRKNFLFLGSDRGGIRAATIYTIVESAKLNGLDPEAYIAAVLDRLARGHPMNRIDELLPWNFKSAPAAPS
ncbi:IS66 family transposase [Acidisoma silvae]|uniref:IS66 family transposase n=1 Tax=Acidisoma silvae TaxID=2802396 RepID=A0A964E0D2_9PROT|nr:IS66 family transposase [Acidisoma silvae]MCB8877395.1 IS66 family transposase [Acidisoma silvae]